MIVVSFLLVLAALVLLVVGVVNGSVGLVLAAIVASLLAALALVVSVRQRAVPAGSLPPSDTPTDLPPVQPPATSGAAGQSTAPPASLDPYVPPADVPPSSERTAGAEAPLLPADEPAVEPTAPADAERLSRRGEQVLVVDGRPRYHLSSCPHLAGRQTVSLPVSGARAAGFSPCGLCTPDRVLLGGG